METDKLNASVAQLVEHHVANVIVAGSIPVTRSIFFAKIPKIPKKHKACQGCAS